MYEYSQFIRCMQSLVRCVLGVCLGRSGFILYQYFLTGGLRGGGHLLEDGCLTIFPGLRNSKLGSFKMTLYMKWYKK